MTGACGTAGPPRIAGNMRYLIAILLLAATTARAQVWTTTNDINGVVSPGYYTNFAQGSFRITVHATDGGSDADLSDSIVRLIVTEQRDTKAIVSNTCSTINAYIYRAEGTLTAIPVAYDVKLVAYPNADPSANYPIYWASVTVTGAASSGVTVGIPSFSTQNTTSYPGNVRIYGGGVLATSVTDGANLHLYVEGGTGGGGGVQSINGWTNLAHEFRASTGMSISNTLSGSTAITWIAFGSTTPIVTTNLSGWTRFQYDQLTNGVKGATSVVVSVTGNCSVLFKTFGAAGGARVGSSAYGGAGAYRVDYVRAPSGSVFTLKVGQGGCTAGPATTGTQVRAYPYGGLTTGSPTNNPGGGGASIVEMDGTLLILASGGAAVSASSAIGVSGAAIGASGPGTMAGTAGTQYAGGITGGGYLMGGDGPGCGGGQGIYGGGAGQASGAAGGSGPSYGDLSRALNIANLPATSVSTIASAGANDTDWTAGIGAPVANAGGGSGRIVMYVLYD